jgi:hypothetical protein
MDNFSRQIASQEVQQTAYFNQQAQLFNKLESN